MDKKKETKLRGKKKAMMEALITSMGNITKSAQKVGISRFTHYDWIRDDPQYKKEYESIDDMECDFYRNALHQLVQEKNVTAVIFGLKTKGKHRGYVERQEMEHSGNLNNTITAETLANVWKEVKEDNDESE